MTNKDISKKLEYCASRKCESCQEENGSGFPWIDGRCYGMTERMYDAIAALSAQEPIAPIENAGFYYCGACKYAFTVHRQKYCSECGRKVKWE